MHPDDRAAVEQAIESALRNGDSYSIEYRIVMPDGEIRWLHSLGRVHQTGLRARSFGMSGIVRDVTLAHRATEAEQRQEQYLEQLRRQDAQQRIDQRYRLLVESLPLGVMLADTEGRITYVNAAWGTLAAGAANGGNAVGIDQLALVHAQDRARVMLAWRALAQQSPAALEFRLNLANAEPRWVHCLSTALRDASGKLLGFAHAAVDTSSQRQQRAATELRHDQVLALAHRLQRLRESERLDLAGLLQREIVNALGRLGDGLVAVDAAATLDDARAGGRRTRAAARRTIERMRRIVYELNPPGIEELGFAGALERVLGDAGRAGGLRIRIVDARDADAGATAHPQVLYSVAQEADREYRPPRARDARAREPADRARAPCTCRCVDNGVGMPRGRLASTALLRPAGSSERLAELGGSLRPWDPRGRAPPSRPHRATAARRVGEELELKIHATMFAMLFTVAAAQSATAAHAPRRSFDTARIRASIQHAGLRPLRWPGAGQHRRATHHRLPRSRSSGSTACSRPITAATCSPCRWCRSRLRPMPC